MTGTSRHFQLNEKVGFLRESGWGIIQRIDGQFVFLVDNLGFERKVHVSELIAIHGESFQIQEDNIQEILQKDIPDKRKRKPTTTSSTSDVWKIDLHIEELVDSHRGMSNKEIVQLQLNSLKKFFEKAKANRRPRFVVIHGVGEGVLREEVRYFFQNMEGIRCSDAAYQEFGLGATLVEINYNLHQ